jgi:hypothetical protein
MRKKNPIIIIIIFSLIMRKNNVGSDLQYEKKNKKKRKKNPQYPIFYFIFFIMRKYNGKQFEPFCIQWGFFFFTMDQVHALRVLELLVIRLLSVGDPHSSTIFTQKVMTEKVVELLKEGLPTRAKNSLS